MVKNVETENDIKIYIYNNNNVDIDKYLQWHQRKWKTSPQAKRHKPSLLITSLTI